MTEQEILTKVELIFRDVFDQQNLAVSFATNSSHIEDWDSLAHISLVSAIEKEFKVKFALAELQGLKNVGEMIQLVQKKQK